MPLQMEVHNQYSQNKGDEHFKVDSLGGDVCSKHPNRRRSGAAASLEWNSRKMPVSAVCARTEPRSSASRLSRDAAIVLTRHDRCTSMCHLISETIPTNLKPQVAK